MYGTAAFPQYILETYCNLDRCDMLHAMGQPVFQTSSVG